MKKTLTPRQQKSLEIRKRIFETAYHLVNEYGEAFTIQDLCTTAQVSVGSFYHYYRSKEAVTEDLYIFFDDHMEKAALSLPEEPAERILALAREMTRYSMDLGLPFMRMSCRTVGGENLMRANSVSYSEIFETLKKGVCEGVFTCPRGEEYYARLFITLFRGNLHWWTVQGGNFDAVVRLQSYIEDFLSLITVK